MIPAVRLLTIFFLRNELFSLRALLRICKTFSCNLYLCSFYISLNDDIVDIKKPDAICSFIFVVDDFSELFLHLSIFSIKDSRST